MRDRRPGEGLGNLLQAVNMDVVAEGRGPRRQNENDDQRLAANVASLKLCPAHTRLHRVR
jgi:hypothetical protein